MLSLSRTLASRSLRSFNAKPLSLTMNFSTSTNSQQTADDYSSLTHFRVSNRAHPLNVNAVHKVAVLGLDGKDATSTAVGEIGVGKKDEETKKDVKAEHLHSHLGFRQNHIWEAEEIDGLLNTLYKHKPKDLKDHMM